MRCAAGRLLAAKGVPQAAASGRERAAAVPVACPTAR